MESIKKNLPILLIIIMAAMFLPWLGETLFNTKGEPREAIVAFSMIESGDWILPVSHGSDIPYKPPFLAWCIAVVALLTGHVDEYVSRLPSAIAAIAMTFITYRYIRRTTGNTPLALLTAAVLITTVEVWRSAWACRVDMVLTACMVCATFSLDNFFANTQRKRLLPWAAILLMSCAVLTKGPVGMILPCLVIGCTRLIRGDRFWPLFGRLALTGILSCVLPALWYIAAYHHGGKEFLDLAMEENFGRFLGKMSYASHEKSWPYNIVTLLMGMLPYTLLALFSLAIIRWRKPAGKVGDFLRCKWSEIRAMDQASLLSLVGAVVIFVFYCIPKSKRSVYLLPMYPFVSYFVALLIIHLVKSDRRRILLPFAAIIAVAAIGSGVALFILAHGLPVVAGWILAPLAVIVGGYLLAIMRKATLLKTVATTWLTIVCVYTLMLGTLLPEILNRKSDKAFAQQLTGILAPQQPLYEYGNSDVHRFYTINFYLGDRMRLFEKDMPEEGLILMNDFYRGEFEKNYPAAYSLEEVTVMPAKSCDNLGVATLYRFRKL